MMKRSSSRTAVSSSTSEASRSAWRGVRAAVAADVDVPALLGGDEAEVLALRLGALAHAAAHRALELVRRANALVAVLDADGEGGRVLHAVAAPRRADAALHRAERLAVRVAALEPGRDELLPDLGELLDARAEEVDALAAGDLGVEAVLLGDLSEGDELVRRDLAARYARHDRVRAVLLDVREEAIVGVLQRAVRLLEDRLGVEAGEDARDRGLADLAAVPRAVLREHLARTCGGAGWRRSGRAPGA